MSFKDKLASWAIKYNPSREAVNSLLLILKHDHPYLPRDKRTLCGTPRHSTVISMDNGQYLHIGLRRALSQFISRFSNHKFNNIIQIDVNIDGVPISKSSSSSLWPILINVVGFDEVICIGTYYGVGKPENVNNYMEMFVDEFISINRNGLVVEGQIYKLVIRAIVADAPARAFLMNIHTHSGYSSCHKCCIRGKYVLNRLTFPNTNNIARTDDDFRMKTDDRHHLSTDTTAIENLSIDCIKNVVVDYMHAALEGVLKQLMVQWILIRRKPYSLKKSSSKLLSENIVYIKTQLPSEFSRSPRPLEYLKRFKATEFRELLLYTIPILTISILEEPVYNHVLKFHCALRILCSNKLCNLYNNLAHVFIRSFIDNFEEIYDEHQYSFNLHSLLHLCEDVNYFKTPLDNISSFKFENFLQSFKTLVKSGNHPLEQINNRYVERMFNGNTEGIINQAKFSKNRDGNYNYIMINNYKFSNRKPNNYCYNNKCKSFINIIKIVDSCESGFIIHGRKISQLSPIYTDPIDSRELGMFKCDQIIFEEIDIFQLNNDFIKAIYINLNDVHYFMTLLH